MRPQLQQRIQRYGWDLAAPSYDRHWRAQLAAVQARVLAFAAPQPGERVLDVACGTGHAALAAAAAVGPAGTVLGIDLSGEMVQDARRRVAAAGLGAGAAAARARIDVRRMDAERLDLPDAAFDVVTCALGLMYMPDPARAVREMHRVLRPGGRVVLAVWGERARCGWAALFGIVDAQVASDVCPLFFGLGQGDALARRCADAGLRVERAERVADTLAYADAGQACSAAFEAGPVALAWSRFTDEVRAQARERYVQAIEPWRTPQGYRIPAEFVIVTARAAAAPRRAAAGG